MIEQKHFSAARLLTLLVTALVFLVGSSSAITAPNEFRIQAQNYDNLAEHSWNCTFLIDKQFAITYCADGFFAIDDTADLINPDTAFKVNANLTFVLEGEPKDIRLDSYLTIVDNPGQQLTVIKRSTKEALHIELNPEDAPRGKILGGFFSPDFIVFNIQNGNESFIQVHSSKQALGVVTAIDNDVVNFEVLDLAQQKDLFYVFATQQVSVTERILSMIQISYSPSAKSWSTPALRTYALDPLQCSDILRVTESIIVQACKSTKTITILRRSTMTSLFQREFFQNRFYFDDIFLMEMEGKGQVYIFYTMSAIDAHRIGMFEALIDEKKSDDEQLIIDWGELAVPSNVDSPSTNVGPIILGGGDKYLLTTFERFTQVKGYTICPYDQVIQRAGSTTCVDLEENNDGLQTVTLNPFDTKVTKCGTDESLSTIAKEKMAFLCAIIEEEEIDVFLMLVLGTLAFGGLCCCTSFCIFCKYRAKSQNAIDDAEAMGGARIYDPIAAQRILEQQKRQKLTLISKLLPKLKYGKVEHKENQDNCAICVEDFAPSTMIRQTPCKHIFHDHCVMKWVETKIDSPDCPFCRAEIKLT